MKKSLLAVLALAAACLSMSGAAWAQTDPPDKPVFNSVYEKPASATAAKRVHAAFDATAVARHELAQPGLPARFAAAAPHGKVVYANVPLDDGILQVAAKKGASKKGKARGGTKT